MDEALRKGIPEEVVALVDEFIGFAGTIGERGTTISMLDLTRRAGIPANALQCENEPLGINIFLNMRKP